MEPKRLKKLVLKKEAISNLSGNQMNRIVGGWGVTTIGNCNSEFTCCTFNYDSLETDPTCNPSCRNECPSDGTRCNTCDMMQASCNAINCYN